jgi:hypothetical protein
VRRRRARKAVTYSAGEIGRVRVVEDFLPPPDALVLRPSGLMLRTAPKERVSKHGPPHPPRRRGESIIGTRFARARWRGSSG